MNCKRCGSELEEGALGCAVCGEPVEPEPFDIAIIGIGDADGPLAGEADDAAEDEGGAAQADGEEDAGDGEGADADGDADGDEDVSAGEGDGADADAGAAESEGAGEDALADGAGPAEDGGDGPREGVPGMPATATLAGAFSAPDAAAAQAWETRGAQVLPQEELIPLEQTPYIAYDAGKLPRLAGELPVLDASAVPQTAYEQRRSRLLVTLIALLLVAALVAIASIWVYNTHLVAKSNVRYTVTYETNGGSRIDAQEVKTGSVIVAPRNPTISGRYFAGWYTDTTYQTQVSFPLEVDHDMTLYARWTRDKDKADKALAAQGSTQGSTQGASTAQADS